VPAQQLAYAFIPDIRDYYPETARVSREQGTASLALCYDQQGKPVDVSVVKSSGFARIDSAAVRWGISVRIKPAIISGVARTGCVLIPVEFSLEQSLEPGEAGGAHLPDPPIIWPQVPPPPPPITVPHVPIPLPVRPIPLAPAAPPTSIPLSGEVGARLTL
jgi:TonB family protein